MRRRTISPNRNLKARPRDRALAWGFTAGVHLAVLAALLWPRTAPRPPEPQSPPPELTVISLAEQPKPPEPPDRPEAAAQAPPPMARPTPMPVPVKVTAPEPSDNSDLLSQAQLAGAASAGESDGGGGGQGRCDTARAVQQALRKDPLVRAAVMDANRLGKATMLWDGDWVRSGVQEGKGLSAVREAVMWEVAFIPEACRNERMHGLVLLSLADGGTRFAIGSGDWRWSDLLGLQPSSR